MQPGKFFSVDVQPLLPPGISPRRMTIAARKIIEVLPLAASKYKLAEPPPPPRGTRDSKFHRLAALSSLKGEFPFSSPHFRAQLKFV